MINCRCPECSEVHNARSSHFGELTVCPSCGCQYQLDTKHLAHFALPEIVAISLKDHLGESLQIPNLVISVEYGYRLPPLQTDSCGRLSIARGIFEKAEQDEVSTGLMDHKGDFSLNRYIRVDVPSPGELENLAEARESSGWPALRLEKEMYASLDAMLNVMRHNNNSKVNHTHTLIDLHKQKDAITVDLVVR